MYSTPAGSYPPAPPTNQAMPPAGMIPQGTYPTQAPPAGMAPHGPGNSPYPSQAAGVAPYGANNAPYPNQAPPAGMAPPVANNTPYPNQAPPAGMAAQGAYTHPNQLWFTPTPNKLCALFSNFTQPKSSVRIQCILFIVGFCSRCAAWWSTICSSNGKNGRHRRVYPE